MHNYYTKHYIHINYIFIRKKRTEHHDHPPAFSTCELQD